MSILAYSKIIDSLLLSTSLIEVVNDRSRSKAVSKTPTTKSISALPQGYVSATSQPIEFDSLITREAAEYIGLGADEYQKTISSGMVAGMRSPR